MFKITEPLKEIQRHLDEAQMRRTIKARRSMDHGEIIDKIMELINTDGEIMSDEEVVNSIRGLLEENPQAYWGASQSSVM